MEMRHEDRLLADAELLHRFFRLGRRFRGDASRSPPILQSVRDRRSAAAGCQVDELKSPRHCPGHCFFGDVVERANAALADEELSIGFFWSTPALQRPAGPNESGEVPS